MDPIVVAQRYFKAWNDRDPAAVAAIFMEGGTYSDPAVPHGLMEPAIAHYAEMLFAAFPDLAFEVVGVTPAAGDGTVAAQWLMRGTNTGSLQGRPPTGRTVALPGADFIAVAGDQIRSVQGYWDQKTFVEQLGLQAIVLPYTLGPFIFGSRVRMATGRRTKPGAISLTWIDVRSDDEEQEVRERSVQIVADQMAQMPGFLSWIGGIVGRRMYTATAWTDPESASRLLRGGPHREAMARVYSGGLGTAVFTSVWTPHHLNALWVRCTGCGQMAAYERAGGKCQCGTLLPETATVLVSSRITKSGSAVALRCSAFLEKGWTKDWT